jgi:integrase
MMSYNERIMSAVPLTDRVIPRLRCAEGSRKTTYRDQRCKGLMLEVRATAGKTWYLRFTDQRGSQRLLRIGDARDIPVAAARKRAEDLRRRIALGEDPAKKQLDLKKSITFAVFIAEHYLPFVKSYKRSWTADDSYLRNHHLPALGTRYLDEITQDEVLAFREGLVSAGYAPGTVNRCLVILRYAFNLALKWQLPGLDHNPTREVKLVADHRQRERYLSEGETRLLYEAVASSDNPLLKYMISLLILTGARKREVLDARWEHIDRGRRQWLIPLPKGGKPRYIPLSEQAMALLDQVAAAQQDLITPERPTQGYLFANPNTGKPFVNIYNSWDTARKRAGLPEVRIHDLRHSFASFLVNNGRSLYEVQRILGHTHIRTTQRYAHLSPDTLLEAVDMAGAALKVPFLE